jgi:hypothetical protein
LGLDMVLGFDFIIMGCAKFSKPIRDLLKSSHRINPSGSACAVCREINRFVMDLTTRPGTKRVAKSTPTTIKVTGVKSSKQQGGAAILEDHDGLSLRKSIALRSRRIF